MNRIVKMGATGPNRVKMRGLGDAVERFTKPIAKAIDSIVGTHLVDCGGCKKRRERLNKAVPFGDSLN